MTPDFRKLDSEPQFALGERYLTEDKMIWRYAGLDLGIAGVVDGEEVQCKLYGWIPWKFYGVLTPAEEAK